MKALGSKPLVAGTVRVNLNSEQTQLIGNCPTCSSRLCVEMRSDGSFGNLVACMRCKEIYRVESKDQPATPSDRPAGFGVSYAIEGNWDAAVIMEYLFDNIGTVTAIQGGFVCHPDEEHTDFPTITVEEGTRTIRFGLFGDYLEREAGAIITQVVSEFGTKFQVNLRPVRFERWEYQEATRSFVQVEQRPLGTLLRERIKKQARA